MKRYFFAVLCAAVALLHSHSGALELQFEPTIPDILTNTSIDQFDLLGSGTGPTLYIVTIDNSGDLNHYSNLQLVYEVLFRAAGSQTSKTIYKVESRPFSMAPNEVAMLSSNQFLTPNNTAVKTSIWKTLAQMPEDELKKEVLTTQKIPVGTITLSMTLKDPFVQHDIKTSSHESTEMGIISLIAPGAADLTDAPEIWSAYPTFIWNSDLRRDIQFTDHYMLSIYEERFDEGPSSAVRRNPVFSTTTSQHQFTYPADAYPLVQGKTYYWQITGTVIGTRRTRIKSPVFGFTLKKLADPEVFEVIQILRLVIDDQFINQIITYDEDVTIKINGTEQSIPDLRNLVQDILQGTYILRSTTVY